MASPQLEEGYTRIANELLEAFARTRLAGREYQIVLTVARLTYGYGKKEDEISYGQIVKITEIPRTKVIPLVKGLILRKIMGSTHNGTRKPTTICINKNYSEWLPSPHKGTSPQEGTISSPHRGTKSSPLQGTHQRKKEIKEIPRSNSSNGGAPPASLPEKTIEAHLSRYSESEQQTIQEAFKAIALTRTSGKVKDSVLLAELAYWSAFEPWKVIGGIRKYLEGEHYLDGKKEAYLRGIIRNFKPVEAKQFQKPRTGSLLDSIDSELCHAID